MLDFQAWIAACQRLIDGQDGIDAQCIPQVIIIMMYKIIKFKAYKHLITTMLYP